LAPFGDGRFRPAMRGQHSGSQVNPVGGILCSWSNRKMAYRIKAESVPGGGAESLERTSPADAFAMALELIREGMQNVQIIDEQGGSYNPHDFERLFVKHR
jgi:hypothetical protein